MKKILFTVGMSGLLLSFGSYVHAHEVEEGNLNQENSIENVVLNEATVDIIQGNSGKQVRMGYHWHCKYCGYTSNWHLLAKTAVKMANANAHTIKYGGKHVTVVYGV